MARKRFTTTVDEELLTALKILAIKINKNVNEILEELIKDYLDQIEEL